MADPRIYALLRWGVRHCCEHHRQPPVPSTPKRPCLAPCLAPQPPRNSGCLPRLLRLPSCHAMVRPIGLCPALAHILAQATACVSTVSSVLNARNVVDEAFVSPIRCDPDASRQWPVGAVSPFHFSCGQTDRAGDVLSVQTATPEIRQSALISDGFDQLSGTVGNSIRVRLRRVFVCVQWATFFYGRTQKKLGRCFCSGEFFFARRKYVIDTHTHKGNQWSFCPSSNLSKGNSRLKT